MSNLETTRVMGATGSPVDRTLIVPGGSTATMMMPSVGDAARTQMGGATVCPICQSATPLMDPYCGDCGFLLASAPTEQVSLPEEEKPAAELVDQQTGRRFRLRTGVNTLGRQGTDILVNDGTVSRNHARITVENGTVTIEDLGSSNGTKVGNDRLTPNQPMKAASGTPLRFGSWNVTLEVGATSGNSASADATIAMPTSDPSDTSSAQGAFSDEDTFTATALIVTPPPVSAVSHEVEPVTGGALVGILRLIAGNAEDIAVTEGIISIGRRPGSTVVLTGDAYVSGRHAEIGSDPTGIYITDLGSTNGTMVNGQKLTPNERQLLMEGDELQIGQSRFRLEAPDGADDTTVPEETVTDKPLDNNIDNKSESIEVPDETGRA